MNKENSLNTSSILHIGVELILMGIMAFYFHKKIDTLRAEIDLLKKDRIEIIASINELHRRIQQLSMMQSSTPMQSPPPPSQPLKTLKKIPKKIVSETIDTGDETLNDSELDAELKTELSQLKKETDLD